MLTVTNWQVDSPGAIAVAGVVARESRTEDHALHLLPDSSTLSWERRNNGGIAAVKNAPRLIWIA